MSKNTDVIPSAGAVVSATGATRIAAWHKAQCNGDWEHGSGVTIETTDNPGWHVKVDLEDTGKEGKSGIVTSGTTRGVSWEIECCTLVAYDEGLCDLELLLTVVAEILESPNK